MKYIKMGVDSKKEIEKMGVDSEWNFENSKLFRPSPCFESLLLSKEVVDCILIAHHISRIVSLQRLTFSKQRKSSVKGTSKQQKHFTMLLYKAQSNINF